MPQSIAYASIPAEFIDPIATDFTLDVTIPNPGYTLVEGNTADVEFTINNNGPGAVDQTTMIIESANHVARELPGQCDGLRRCVLLQQRPEDLHQPYVRADRKAIRLPRFR